MSSETEPPFTDRDIPEEFLYRMSDLLGAEYQDFLKCIHMPATVGLRVNTLKIQPNDLINKISSDWKPVSWCPSGFYGSASFQRQGYPTAGKHPYHAAGLYYLQEPSAMAAAEILEPQPGDKVLDLSAAPGGKSTHIATLMMSTGLLVANEIHPKRVWDLAENLERCGVTNAVVTNESPGRLVDHFSAYFDRVMLDAPCSGEGMFRKSDAARREWNPGLSKSCASRQNAILEQAARLVKPGGFLAYTTCTYSPIENEAVIGKFLDFHPEFDVYPVSSKPGLQPARPDWIGLPADHKINRAVRIWPHHAEGEGHFIAILVKKQSIDNHPSRQQIFNKRIPKSKADRNKSDYASLQDFASMHLRLSFDERNIYRYGSYLYRCADETPNLDGLKVIHPGWWLGSLQKGRFTPSHALAMGIGAEMARQTVPLKLGDPLLSAYLNGQTFISPGENGWVLITLDGFPLGWGKRVNQVVKNNYPHGLRQYQ